MTDLGEQAMLFGAIETAEEAAQHPPDTLTLCALNVASPNRARSHRIAEWLLGQRAQVLVLTELRNTDACRELLESLRADGYSTTHAIPSSDDTEPFFAAIVTRQVVVTPISATQRPRLVGVDIAVAPPLTPIRLVGMYAPTNGMTAESSRRRQQFQHDTINYLRGIHTPRIVVAGDFNVIEPGHRPRLPAFEAHDYRFYTDLEGLGLRDAFRTLHPDAVEHSWLSSRFGNQRIDHTFVGPSVSVQACVYDHAPRQLDLSDHAAMITRIDIADRSASTYPTGSGASK